MGRGEALYRSVRDPFGSSARNGPRSGGQVGLMKGIMEVLRIRRVIAPTFENR